MVEITLQFGFNSPTLSEGNFIQQSDKASTLTTMKLVLNCARYLVI